MPLRPIWAPALALVALLAVTQYSGNRPLADGGFLLDPMGDQPLHAGIAWELTLPYPPEVPGLAGIPLHYHYGADLVRAAALRWTSLQPYDALSRVEPTLWALGLMLVLSSLTARLGGSRLAVGPRRRALRRPKNGIVPGVTLYYRRADDCTARGIVVVDDVTGGNFVYQFVRPVGSAILGRDRSLQICANVFAVRDLK